jgi:hypothetical protein
MQRTALSGVAMISTQPPMFGAAVAGEFIQLGMTAEDVSKLPEAKG